MRVQALCVFVVVFFCGVESDGPLKRLLHRHQEPVPFPGFDFTPPHLGGLPFGNPQQSNRYAATRQQSEALAPEQLGIEDKLQQARKVINAGNTFGLKLMKYLIGENDNTIMAPVSLSVALGMLYFASAGNTKKQLAEGLHYNEFGLDSQSIITPMRYLTAIAKGSKPEGFAYENANFVFTQKEANISQGYRNLIKDLFGGLVEKIDFKNPAEAVKQMNSLITSVTKNQIANPVDAVDPNTKLILTNAVYFKGFWKKPFSIRSSFNSTFLNDGTDEIPIKMMYMRDTFLTKSLPELSADAIQLPYEGDTTIMLVLLPKDPHGVNQMLQKLNFVKILNDLPSYQNESLDLLMPRFSVRGSYNLKQQLHDIGIKDLFIRGKADLPELDPKGNLVLEDVIHEAKIRVDERGTEAVALTTAPIITYSRYPAFTVRHPFVFFMIHKPTGSIFFAGKILRMNKTM